MAEIDKTNNTGREYKYQVDYSLAGKMYHVRCDDWEDFKEAILNIESILPNDQVAAETPHSDTGARCKTCGANVLPEKRITGRDGRGWWVQECVTGDKSHKGPIRPANS